MEPRQINLINTNSKDYYFVLGKRPLCVGEETSLTVSLKEKANIGDIVLCESLTATVINVEEERPHKIEGNTFQKLIIVIQSKSK